MKLFAIASFAAVAQAQIGTCGKYGCSKNMDTTGCSSQTGSQDGCGSGISCSRKMAENDNSRTRQHRYIEVRFYHLLSDWKLEKSKPIYFRSKFRGAGSNKSIDHCILGGISSRESRSGNALTTWNGEFGWGDCHGGTCYGFGLMQIDRRYHSKQGSWDS